MIQIACIAAATVVFFVLERVLPGRELPESSGWYLRAAVPERMPTRNCRFRGIRLGPVVSGALLVSLVADCPKIAQGAIGWFVGTFVFYWWHRIRHDSDVLWRICHQVHHSPSRIELLTAFYKHPVEIAADLIISSALLLLVLGASPAGAAWFNVFATTGRVLLSQQFTHTALVGLLLATA